MPDEKPKQEEKVEEIQEEVVEEENSEEKALENSKNPKRTKEYIDKLKDENKQYKNLLESLIPETPAPQQQQQQYQQPINRAPSAQNFSNLDQQQVNDVFQGMIDKDGWLDGQKLMDTLKSMNDRAQRAEQALQQSTKQIQQMQQSQRDFEVSQTMQKVHDKYPQLNPESEEFDPEFWETVQNDLIGQMMRGEENPMKAADRWYNKLYKAKDMGKREEQQRQENDSLKRQANTIRPRSTMVKGHYDSAEDDQLVRDIRAGKRGALAEKLRRIGQ